MPTEDKEPSSEAIEERLLAFIRAELVIPGSSIGRDDELLSGAILDSIGVVRLGSFVAEEFELDMKPADFVIENFGSVAVLAGYIRRARGG